LQNIPLSNRLAVQKTLPISSNLTGIPTFQVPRQCRPWLFDSGSLTKRLLEASHQQFNVRVLRQYQGKTTPEEQFALNLRARSLPFVREVELLCFDTPWVFARTLIPLSTLTGGAKALTQLGSKPLGAALFNSPYVSRGAIIVKKIHSSLLPLSQDIDPQWLWGRHSVFYINQAPLLVNEIFLPDSPLYSQ